jgi:hypothetical protein
LNETHFTPTAIEPLWPTMKVAQKVAQGLFEISSLEIKN